jgi:hypothetical protein
VSSLVVPANRPTTALLFVSEPLSRLFPGGRSR